MAELARPQMMLLHFTVLYHFTKLLGDAGKIKLQKLTYFLQEAWGVDLSYSFKLHHYGPYSEELEDDLSIMKSIGLVNIERDPQGYGFHVTALSEDASDWLPLTEELEKKIHSLFDDFGDIDAGTLELYATVHFAHKLLPEVSKDDVLEVVRSLKPRFAKEEIARGYETLEAKEYI